MEHSVRQQKNGIDHPSNQGCYRAWYVWSFFFFTFLSSSIDLFMYVPQLDAIYHL